MPPDIYYKQRLNDLTLELKILLKRKTTLAWLRFATIIAIISCWYFLYPSGLLYALIPSILLLILFTRLVFADLKNKSKIEHTNYLIAINEEELKALTHNYYHFADGNEFMPKEHFYANDLDIFGHASLYQYINRTSSDMGSSTLADWLLNPTNTNSILHRQAAIKELADKNEWRQKLQAFGAAKKIQTATQVRLQKWFEEENRFITNKYWSVLRYLLPVIMLTVIVLNIADILSNPIRNYFLLAAAVIAFYQAHMM